MALIDKDTLVAEIERRKKQYEEWKNSCKGISSLSASIAIQEDINILCFINTLEVKEVDLEREYECYMNKEISEKEWIREDYLDFAKHFFELGLRAIKEGVE